MNRNFRAMCSCCSAPVSRLAGQTSIEKHVFDPVTTKARTTTISSGCAQDLAINEDGVKIALPSSLTHSSICWSARRTVSLPVCIFTVHHFISTRARLRATASLSAKASTGCCQCSAAICHSPPPPSAGGILFSSSAFFGLHSNHAANPCNTALHMLGDATDNQ